MRKGRNILVWTYIFPEMLQIWKSLYSYNFLIWCLVCFLSLSKNISKSRCQSDVNIKKESFHKDSPNKKKKKLVQGTVEKNLDPTIFSNMDTTEG